MPKPEVSAVRSVLGAPDFSVCGGSALDARFSAAAHEPIGATGRIAGNDRREQRIRTKNRDALEPLAPGEKEQRVDLC